MPNTYSQMSDEELLITLNNEFGLVGEGNAMWQSIDELARRFKEQRAQLAEVKEDLRKAQLAIRRNIERVKV